MGACLKDIKQPIMKLFLLSPYPPCPPFVHAELNLRKKAVLHSSSSSSNNYKTPPQKFNKFLEHYLLWYRLFPFLEFDFSILI